MLEFCFVREYDGEWACAVWGRPLSQWVDLSYYSHYIGIGSVFEYKSTGFGSIGETVWETQGTYISGSLDVQVAIVRASFIGFIVS